MQQQQRTTKVVIYTTLNCPHCQHAKKWLTQRRIPFLDFNVAKPGRIQRQFFQLGGHSVPLIMVGKRRLNGFNPHQLQEVLETAGLLPMNLESSVGRGEE